MTAITILAILGMGLILGLMGGGGSILSVPILVYLMELPDKAAIATSLFVVGASSIPALVAYTMRGMVDVRIGIIFGVFAMAGSFIGGALARFIPGTVLLVFFGVLMTLAAVMMLRGRDETDGGSGPKEKLPIVIIGIEGIVVGIVTGLVGAGGGFLVVPALVLLSGLSMKRAVGTSLFVIVMKSFSGFLGYISHVEVDMVLALQVSAVAIVGSLMGFALSMVVSGQRLRKGFGIFVLVMGVFVLGRELPFDVQPAALAIAMVVAGVLGVAFSAVVAKRRGAA